MAECKLLCSSTATASVKKTLKILLAFLHACLRKAVAVVELAKQLITGTSAS